MPPGGRAVIGGYIAVQRAIGEQLAEGVGFEPTVESPPRRFSRPVP